MWHGMLRDSDFMMCWENVDGGSFSFPQVLAFLSHMWQLLPQITLLWFELSISNQQAIDLGLCLACVFADGERAHSQGHHRVDTGPEI